MYLVIIRFNSLFYKIKDNVQMKKKWIKVGIANIFPINMGSCIKYENEQIAIFNIDHKKWYAVQNMCPHEQRMVLSRGLIGDTISEPRVACPLHKRRFSLKTGHYLGDDECASLKTYPIKIERDEIYIQVNGQFQEK